MGCKADRRTPSPRYGGHPAAVLLVLLALAATALLPAPADAATRRTANAIEVDDSPENTAPGTALIATAFAVGRGDTWVTARHTALACRERYIVVTGPGGFAQGLRRVPAQVVALSGEADLALLTTPHFRAVMGGLPFATVHAAAAGRSDVDSVAVMARDQATGRLSAAKLELTDPAVRIHMRTTLPAPFTGYFLTASADQPTNPRPGASGAPVMDLAGRVVGSVVGGMNDAPSHSHFTLAVPTETMVSFLLSHRVPLDAAPPMAPTPARIEAAVRPLLCIR